MIEMFWDNLFSFVFGVAVSAIFFWCTARKKFTKIENQLKEQNEHIQDIENKYQKDILLNIFVNPAIKAGMPTKAFSAKECLLLSNGFATTVIKKPLFLGYIETAQENNIYIPKNFLIRSTCFSAFFILFS